MIFNYDIFTTVQVWLPEGNVNFSYPELSLPDVTSKVGGNIGVACSGGGLRAATQALGWLRALNQIGFLKVKTFNHLFMHIFMFMHQ